MKGAGILYPVGMALMIGSLAAACSFYSSTVEAEAAVVKHGAKNPSAMEGLVNQSSSDDPYISDVISQDTGIYPIDADTVEPVPEIVEIDPEDLEYMTMVLVGECQSSSWEHQLAVGSVVLNRVADERFPGSVKAVCLQKGQYACFRDGNAYRTPTVRNREAAEYLLVNGTQIPANVVWQSQAKQGKGVWKKIDRHYFCY